METPFTQSRIIQLQEGEAAASIHSQYSRELSIVDMALDQVLVGLHDFGAIKRKPDSSLESARLFLATRSFNSLWTARQILERGYFQQAMTLVRMAMEDQLIAGDIEIHPPTLNALLDRDKGIESFASMADRLGPQGREVWDSNYGMASEYAAHTRPRSLQSLNSVGPDGQSFLRPGGNYDEVYATATLFLLSQEIVKVMKIIGQLTVPLESDWVIRAMPAFEANDLLWKSLDEKFVAQLGALDEHNEQ